MKNRSGQLLIEIVMAIGVAVIALLAMSKVSSKSVSVSGSAVRQTQASNYARSAIDIMRNIKSGLSFDAYFTEPRFQSGVYCYDGSNIVVATHDFCTIGATEFQGQVTVTQSVINSKTELSIKSEVRWVEGNLTRITENVGKMVLNP